MTNKPLEMKPGTARVAAAVARVTFAEIVRDKVLYNVLLCATLLLGISFLASKLTTHQQDRVILDFGFFSISVSCAMIAIFTGAGMVGREFDRRTIFVALSRPISRLQYVFGKFVGLAGVLLVNWLLLSAAFLLILWYSSPDVFGQLAGSTLYLGLVLVLLQSWVVAALAIVFSCFTTTSLSVIFTIGIFLVGNNISQIRLVANRASGLEKLALEGVAAFLPNFEHFNLGLKVTYGLPVGMSFAVTSVAYGLLLIAVCVFVSGLLLRKRDA